MKFRLLYLNSIRHIQLKHAGLTDHCLPSVLITILVNQSTHIHVILLQHHQTLLAIICTNCEVEHVQAWLWTLKHSRLGDEPIANVVP